MPLPWMRKSTLGQWAALNNMILVLSAELSITINDYCQFARMQKYEFLIFGIFVVQGKNAYA